MSDNRIRIIPADPEFIPDREVQDKLLTCAKRLAPAAEKFESGEYGSVQFIDCGSNLSAIKCPLCGSALDPGWWQNIMGELSVDDGISMEEFTLPCCGRAADISRLLYDFDQGFSRYCLDILNPNINGLSGTQVSEIESIMGRKIKVIYQHI